MGERMKLWFSRCISDGWYTENEIKIGINWYKHVKPKPMFKPWFGFSIEFVFFKWIYLIHFVDDFKAHQEKTNYRSTYKRKEK